MARKSKMSVLKRQRELRKAQKAALKQQRRSQREPSGEQKVASREDLEDYGFPGEELPPAEPEEEQQV